MGQERTNYRYDTMLIEASRILEPQFDVQGIWLSGAQVELLRNTMMVLNNPKTFVDEYQDGYYLTATDNDWDAIRAIVADLEGKLMGNDNVIWGFNDRLLTREAHTMLSPGSWTQEHPVVPAGEIWVMQGLSVYTNETGAFYDTYIDHGLNATQVIVRQTPTALSWDVATNINFVLEAGDFVFVEWSNTVVGQQLVTDVWGHKMKVPA